jgi:hypothetical protein
LTRPTESFDGDLARVVLSEGFRGGRPFSCEAYIDRDYAKTNRFVHRSCAE